MNPGTACRVCGISRFRHLVLLAAWLVLVCPSLLADQLRLPEVLSISRVSGPSLSAPATVSYSITLKPSTSAVAIFAISLVTPSGATRTISFTAPIGTTLATSVTSDWQNGAYNVSRIFVSDAWGRQISYTPDGQVAVSVPSVTTTAPTTHAIAFSALGFTVSGGVTQPLPPRFTALTLQNGGTLSVGSVARYAYTIAPGTSTVARMRFLFQYGFANLGGFQSKLIEVASPATSGTVDFPITGDLLTSPVRLISISIFDVHNRSTFYSTTSLTDTGYTADSSQSPHAFDLSIRGFTITGAQLSYVPPSVTFTFNGGTTFTVGNPIVLNYNATGGSGAVQSVTFSIRSPFGGTISLTGNGSSGSVSTTVGADWINGDYIVSAVPLDVQGRTSTGATRPFTVTGGVAIPPYFTQQPPASETRVQGVLLTIPSQAMGAGPPNYPDFGAVAYQWYAGLPGDTSRPISGATSAHLSITATDSTSYFVRATSAGLFTDSTAVNVTVIKRPVITQHPTGQSVALGGTATFSISANANNGALSFRWRSNRGDFDSNQPTFTLSNVTAGDAGYVSCVVSNIAGSVNSTNVILNVRVATSPLAITQEPADAVAGLGVSGIIRFEAAAAGNPPLIYQWQKNGADISDGPAVRGASTPLLRIGSGSGITTSDDGAYRLKVTNGVETVHSRAATLSFARAPYISALQGAGATTAVVGNYLSLFPVVLGDMPFTYQWRKNGMPITGATADRLNLGPFALSDAGSYDVVVSNAFGSATSQAAVVTVSAEPLRIVGTRFPSSQPMTVGQSAVFGIEVTGSAPAYQWSKNGNAIVGATTANFSIPAVTTSDAGNYVVTATNAASQVSTSFTLGVQSQPLIAVQPLSQTVGIGATVILNAQVFGAAPLQLQWRRNGVPLDDIAPAISGTRTDTLRLSNVSTADAGSYDLVVTNSAGSATSTPAILAVVSSPSISTQPSDQTVIVGGNATFSVVAAGSPPISYRWHKNGVAIAGQTLPALLIASTQTADAGNYSVTVSNNSGSVTSNTARLFVNPAVALPRITAEPRDLAITVGGDATFSVAATGSSLTYQWSRNGTPIPGATASSYSIAGVQGSHAGSYSVIVRNDAGSVSSALAVLSVRPVSYAGTYFGAFGGNRGAWALHVRPDNNGRLIGYLTQTRSAFVADIAVRPDGTFSEIGTATVAGAPLQNVSADQYHGVAAAPQTFTVAGRIGQVGNVTGDFDTTVSMEGTADVATATPSSSAGDYTAPALNVAAGIAYVVVGPSGRAFVITTTATGADFTTGFVTANGGLSAGTASGAQLQLTVGGPSQVVAVTLLPAGSSTATSFMGLTSGGNTSAYLVNLSVLTALTRASDSFTLGYVVGGAEATAAKPLLIRAAGPSLVTLGVAGALADPKIELFSNSTKLSENDNWGGSPELAAAMAGAGAFAYASPTAKDAAALASVTTRDNSVRISAADSGTGNVIAEIYDATPAAGFSTLTPRLVNFSVLKPVETGLTAGFVVGGVGPMTVLIRAAGPTLGNSPFNLAGVITDPQLTLFDGASRIIGLNDNWGTPAAPGAASATQLSTVLAQVGAFPFAADSRDAALLVTLSPGSYTVRIQPASGATGTALLEIYEVR